MTYNFDPDRWRDDRLARLEIERDSGRLSKEEYVQAVGDVERRYENMLKRLDATFDLHPSRPDRRQP
jgi:hypothetical protein